MTKPFKTCPSCQTEWATQKDFIDDHSLKLNGYMPNFKQLEDGIFFFTHDVVHCLSTLAVEAALFLNLYDGPYYEERMTRSEDCPGYCMDMAELNSCPVKCECAYVREISRIIQDFKSGLFN